MQSTLLELTISAAIKILYSVNFSFNFYYEFKFSDFYFQKTLENFFMYISAPGPVIPKCVNNIIITFLVMMKECSIHWHLIHCDATHIAFMKAINIIFSTVARISLPASI